MFNIAEEIFSRAEPCRLAVIAGETTWSYQELDRLSVEVEGRLRLLFAGIRAPRIGLSCPDGAAYIVIAMGILRAGGSFVPLAPELTASERAHLASTISLHFILASDDGETRKIDFRADRQVVPEPPPWEEDLSLLNPAFIRFSSGTTGRSKGIVLSHETLRHRIEAANIGLQIGPNDRVLWVMAMSHHFAVSIILYLWHGATIVLPSSPLAHDILKTATRHEATVFYAAPFHYELLASNVGQASWPSLRLAVSTTAKLAKETAAAFDKSFGVHPAQALGLIEAGLPFVNLPDPRGCPDSVGCIQPNFAFELRDEQGNVVKQGNRGELFIQGPGFFDAYIDPWKERTAVMDDGWFSTGDIAWADADGRITLVGRTRSAISFGGMKFSPEEVEEVLCEHPLIKEARVFGSTHPTFGMVPCAEIVPDRTAPVRLEFCHERSGAAASRPAPRRVPRGSAPARE